MHEMWAALLLAVVLLLGLYLANVVYWLGAPFYISRKVAHAASVPPMVLMPVLFDGPAWPLILTGGFLVMLAVTHPFVVWPGFAKKGRWSELYYPLAVFLSIALLWDLSPWAAIVPGLWLALGDGITGIVRTLTLHREEKGWWGSLACLGVCAGIALLVQPVWVGLVAGAVATTAERFCGDAKGALLRVDDNLAMPVAGLVVMYPMLHYF